MQQGQAGAGQAQGATADPHQQVIAQGLFRQAAAIKPHGQHRAEQQYGNGDGGQQALGQAQCRRGGGQVAQGRQGGQGRQGTAQGQAGEQGHVGDVGGPQAMPSIKPVAHRAPGEQRQADGVADGESGESAQGQGAPGKIDPGITTGGPLIAQQDDEADDGRAQCAEQGRLGYFQDRVVQGVEIQLAEQVAAGDQGNGEQQQGHHQAERLAVFAQQFQPAQTSDCDGLCSGIGVL